MPTNANILLVDLPEGTYNIVAVGKNSITGESSVDSPIDSFVIENSPLGVPAPPIILNYLAGDRFVDITWEYPMNTTAIGVKVFTLTDPSNPLSVPVFRYDIFAESLFNPQTHRITGLTNGIQYQIGLATFNIHGYSEIIYTPVLMPNENATILLSQLTPVDKHLIVIRDSTGRFKKAYSNDIFTSADLISDDPEGSLIDTRLNVPVTNIFRDDIEVSLDPYGNCLKMMFRANDSSEKIQVSPTDIVELWLLGGWFPNQAADKFYRYWAGEIVTPNNEAVEKLNPLNSYSSREFEAVGLSSLLGYVDTGISKTYGEALADYSDTYTSDLAWILSDIVRKSDVPDAILLPPLRTYTMGDKVVESIFPPTGVNIVGFFDNGSVDLLQVFQKAAAIALQQNIPIVFGVNRHRRLYMSTQQRFITNLGSNVYDENLDPTTKIVAEMSQSANIVTGVRWHIATANMNKSLCHNYADKAASIPDPLTYVSNSGVTKFGRRMIPLAVDKNLPSLKPLQTSEISALHDVVYNIRIGSLSAAYVGGAKQVSPNLLPLSDGDPTSYIEVECAPDPFAPYWAFRISINIAKPLKFRRKDIVALSLTLKPADNSREIARSELYYWFDGTPAPIFDSFSRHYFHARKITEPTASGGVVTEVDDNIPGEEMIPIEERYDTGFPDLNQVWLFTGDRRRLHRSSTMQDAFLDPLENTFNIEGHLWGKQKPGTTPGLDTEGDVIVPPIIAIEDFRLYVIDTESLDAQAQDQYVFPETNNVTISRLSVDIPKPLVKIKALGETEYAYTDLLATEYKLVISSEQSVLTFVSIGEGLKSIYDIGPAGNLQASGKIARDRRAIFSAINTSILKRGNQS